jgi:hypothetical protein
MGGRRAEKNNMLGEALDSVLYIGPSVKYFVRLDAENHAVQISAMEEIHIGH